MIDIDIPVKTRNKRARWVTTTGADPVELHSPQYNSQLTPYHALGLDGRGLVVGAADTGVDVNSCYFRDAKEKAPFDTMNER